MKHFAFAAIGAALILTLAYCTEGAPKATSETTTAQPGSTNADLVKRGEYLVTTGGWAWMNWGSLLPLALLAAALVWLWTLQRKAPPRPATV